MQTTNRTRPLIFLTMLALLATIAVAVQVFRADQSYFRAEKAAAIFRDMRAAPASDPRESQYLARADFHVEQARKIWPDNPTYLVLAAQTRVWQGYLQASNSETYIDQSQAYREAINLLRRALNLSPANAHTWALLAEYKAATGERDREWHIAREKALELGGANTRLVERMLAL